MCVVFRPPCSPIPVVSLLLLLFSSRSGCQQPRQSQEGFVAYWMNNSRGCKIRGSSHNDMRMNLNKVLERKVRIYASTCVFL